MRPSSRSLASFPIRFAWAWLLPLLWAGCGTQGSVAPFLDGDRADSPEMTPEGEFQEIEEEEESERPEAGEIEAAEEEPGEAGMDEEEERPEIDPEVDREVEEGEETEAGESDGEGFIGDHSSYTPYCPEGKTPGIYKIAHMGGNVGTVAVRGNVAYALMPSAGLAIFDIQNPDEVRVLATLYIPGPVTALSVGENYAYVTRSASAGEEFLWVVDVSDPERPFLANSLLSPESSYAYPEYSEIHDGILWMGDDYGNLLSLDLTDPVRPSFPSCPAFRTGNPIRDMAIKDGRLYLLTGSEGLQIFEILGPCGLNLLSSFTEEMEEASEPASEGSLTYWRMDIDPDRPFVYLQKERDVPAQGMTYYLSLIDVSDPASPVEKSTVFLEESGEYFWISRIGGVEGGVVVASLNGTLRTVAASDEGVLTIGSQVVIGSDYIPHITYVPSRRLVLFGHGNRLRIYSVDQGLTARAQFFPWPTRASEMACGRDTLWVADEKKGLMGFDLSHPDAFRPLSMPEQSGGALGVALQGEVGALRRANGDIEFWDLHDPRSPVFLSRLDSEGKARRLAWDGRGVWVTRGKDGLAYIDASDPAHPRWFGAIETDPKMAVDLDVADESVFLLLNDSAGLIRRYIASDLGRPVEEFSEFGPTDGSFMRLLVHDDLILVSKSISHNNQLSWIWRRPGIYSTHTCYDCPASGAWAAKGSLVVSAAGGSLVLYDLTDHRNLTPVDKTTWEGTFAIESVTMRLPFVYASWGEGGVGVYRVICRESSSR